ncbi:hypothetical protein AGLY_007896 [Aphis glycines]|uniref:Uncharacterized protein n=1 Tax=Aphis glycines TaxID=307491 RepID=A0A6G0TNB3_APHGL|nr:hypothetical protein AGLY_007896 [Aphis glycines]
MKVPPNIFQVFLGYHRKVLNELEFESYSWAAGLSSGSCLVIFDLLNLLLIPKTSNDCLLRFGNICFSGAKNGAFEKFMNQSYMSHLIVKLIDLIINRNFQKQLFSYYLHVSIQYYCQLSYTLHYHKQYLPKNSSKSNAFSSVGGSKTLLSISIITELSLILSSFDNPGIESSEVASENVIVLVLFSIDCVIVVSLLTGSMSIVLETLLVITSVNDGISNNSSDILLVASILYVSYSWYTWFQNCQICHSNEEMILKNILQHLHFFLSSDNLADK